MPKPRIYTQQPLEIDQKVELGQSASRHLCKALRLKEGASIILFNGQGGEYQAIITHTNKKSVIALPCEFVDSENESPLKIHLGICISRGERMDHIIQKSTELGVTEITPIVGERTEVKLKAERQKRKLAHWQQIAISACEQSGRNRIPSINDIQKPEHWLKEIDATTKLVLHHRNSNSLKDIPVSESVALLVGPEGGLNDDEIASAEDCGFKSLALGPRVLRTETAPLAAIAILQAFWGDMV